MAIAEPARQHQQIPPSDGRNQSVSRLRTVLCAVGLLGAVSLRLSSLPRFESLTAHSIAVGLLGAVALGVALISALIAVRSPVARKRSVVAAIAATISVLMQILKVLLAGNGHRELRFENHILIDPPESLTYFNIPLVVANTADIALWVLGLALSASVTLAIKHR